jgi:ubiquinol-cytochrome c reductase cytochrome b subunit
MSKFGGSPFKEKMPSSTKPSKSVDASQFKAMEKKDMDAIARYLAAESAGATDPNHDADGAKLIASRCTTCHLFRGQSDDATSAAPELLGWASIPWTIAQVANPGTDATYRAASMSADLEGHMPRYDEKLSPDDVSLVARLVWARAHAKK